MRVALIAKPGHPQTGVGRYVEMLAAGLAEAGHPVARVAPSLPPLPAAAYAMLRRLRVDLRAFLLNFPVWARYPPADVYHLSSQNLASLLVLRRPPGRAVVTVHDILPYMLRDDPRLSVYRGVADRLLDRLAMAGLRRADALLADSEYTRRCIIEQLGVDPARIRVVHLGVDHARFRPAAAGPGLRERHGLRDDRRYLIYVGSEDPRKNLAALLRALAAVRRERPEVELLKVGRAHFAAERRALLALAGELGLAGAVHFLDDVGEADLPGLYAAAELAVQPSLYEGFGFPVLEAMACGTPVVCARAASLPELAGAAAELVAVPPGEPGGLTAAILDLLARPERRAELRAAGLAQAAGFCWRRCTELTAAAYGDGRNLPQIGSNSYAG